MPAAGRNISDLSQGPAAPTRTTSQPTKLGKLLKILTPIAMGGAVGATSGNWHVPGSGGQAAENFFANQNAQAMQRAQFGRQYQSDQFKDQLEFAKAQHELKQPYFTAAAGRTWVANGHTWGIDPYSGEPVDRGTAPANDHFVPMQAANGFYKMDTKTGDTTPATDSSVPRGVGPVTTSADIPIQPESVVANQQREQDRKDAQQEKEVTKKKPKPVAVTDSDATGASTTHLIDENPDSPTFGNEMTPKPVATRAPKPKSGSTPDKAKVEQYAQAALEAAGGKADAALTGIDAAKIPPEIKAAVRNRIREIKRPGEAKKKFSLSPEDMAKLMAAPK